MKKPVYIFIFCFLSLGLWAQEEENAFQEINEDDLGNVTDEFQENFFEALKQKGIENYEKAITALEKCLEIDSENAVVYFELGKNYKELEEFDRAVENFEKARDLAPEKESILVEIYRLHRENEDYAEAISGVKDLLEFNEVYKEDLANLYMLNEDYELALETLDELDEERGASSYRTDMRRQIYARTGDTDAQIGDLEEDIEADPENEQNYLNLIYIYSNQGEEDLAFETAKELLETNPGSELVHLALYKFYLNRDEAESAVNSMKIVFESEEVDADSKFKVLNDFLSFLNENEGYEAELEEVSKSLIERENAPELYEQLGRFYLNNENKTQALKYFESGLQQDAGNFELVKNTLLLQIETGSNEEALELSREALESFPAQPFLYLLQGVALNNLKKHAEAKEILTFGLDYLIDDLRMEIDFYNQLALAHQELGEKDKSAEFEGKAGELIKELED